MGFNEMEKSELAAMKKQWDDEYNSFKAKKNAPCVEDTSSVMIRTVGINFFTSCMNAVCT